MSSIKKISLDNQLIVITLGKYGSCYYLNGLIVCEIQNLKIEQRLISVPKLFLKN
mgnify:CR=1 FL=1